MLIEKTYYLSKSIPDLEFQVLTIKKLVLKHKGKEIGKARIEYNTFDLFNHRVGIHQIYTLECDKETNDYLSQFAPKKSKFYRFMPSPELKNDIENALSKITDKFIKDFTQRKIKIKINIVGCDFPREVLSIDKIEEIEKIEIETWSFFSNFLDEYYPWAYEAFNWIKKYGNFKEGDDVTDIFWKEVKRRLEKKEERDRRIQEIFNKAKETGEKQLIYQYPEPCNDKNESCEVDIIYVYAMPDGTYKEERHHTW